MRLSHTLCTNFTPISPRIRLSHSVAPNEIPNLAFLKVALHPITQTCWTSVRLFRFLSPVLFLLRPKKCRNWIHDNSPMLKSHNCHDILHVKFVLLVFLVGFEPTYRSTTPSTLRVCQFRHKNILAQLESNQHAEIQSLVSCH